MAVDKLNPQFLVTFLNKNQRAINTAVVVLLSLYLLAAVAEWVWRVMPEPQGADISSVQNRASSPRAASQSANISKLQRLNLFGEVNVEQVAQVVETVTDAPETRLNLVLTGVVSSSTPENGAAIIEHRNAQNTYGVGEKIDGTNATLRLVQADRVIIRNGVRDETLMLEGIDYEQANRDRNKDRALAQRAITAATPAKVVGPKPASTAPKLSSEAAEATRQLRNSPDSFIDFISIAPHRENNQIVGYRVSPGRNPSIFEAVGLKSGDVITQINGLDVTDPDQTMEAMGALRSASSIELAVTRSGEPMTLYLELPEPTDS